MRLILFPLICCLATVGGLRYADEGEFPFQVTIKDLRRNVSLCSGVLITPRTVLTTASCVSLDSEVKVAAGSSQKSKQNQTITSTQVLVHHKYSVNNSGNDIAIIKLGDPFPMNKNMQTARVPVKKHELVASGSLSGWEAIDVKDILKVIDNYTIVKECKVKYNITMVVDQFCGDYSTLESGSVLSINGTVYGLLTGGNSTKNYHTFLKISDHEDWLKENLGEELTDVKWHESGRNHAESLSNCMAAVLLLAVYLCK